MKETHLKQRKAQMDQTIIKKRPTVIILLIVTRVYLQQRALTKTNLFTV